jgi:hypothetical protein
MTLKKARDPFSKKRRALALAALAYALGTQIGELGLRPRHRILYIFDFGDNHRFACSACSACSACIVILSTTCHL